MYELRHTPQSSKPLPLSGTIAGYDLHEVTLAMTPLGTSVAQRQQQQHDIVNGKSFTLNASLEPILTAPADQNGSTHRGNTMPKKNSNDSSSNDEGYMPGMGEKKKKRGFLGLFKKKDNKFRVNETSTPKNIKKKSQSMSAISEQQLHQQTPGPKNETHQQPKLSSSITTNNVVRYTSTSSSVSDQISLPNSAGRHKPVRATSKREAPAPPSAVSKNLTEVHAPMQVITETQTNHSRGSSNSSGFDETNISPLESPANSSREIGPKERVPSSTVSSLNSNARLSIVSNQTLTHTQASGLEAFMSLKRKPKKQAPTPPVSSPTVPTVTENINVITETVTKTSTSSSNTTSTLSAPQCSSNIGTDVDTTKADDLLPEPDKYSASESRQQYTDQEYLPPPPEELLGTTNMDNSSNGDLSYAGSSCREVDSTVEAPVTRPPAQFIAPPPPNTRPPPDSPQSEKALQLFLKGEHERYSNHSSTKSLDDKPTGITDAVQYVDSSTQVHAAPHPVGSDGGDRTSLVSQLSGYSINDDISSHTNDSSNDSSSKHEVESFLDKMKVLTDTANLSSVPKENKTVNVADITLTSSEDFTVESTVTQDNAQEIDKKPSMNISTETDAKILEADKNDTSMSEHSEDLVNNKNVEVLERNENETSSKKKQISIKEQLGLSSDDSDIQISESEWNNASSGSEDDESIKTKSILTPKDNPEREKIKVTTEEVISLKEDDWHNNSEEKTTRKCSISSTSSVSSANKDTDKSDKQLEEFQQLKCESECSQSVSDTEIVLDQEKVIYVSPDGTTEEPGMMNKNKSVMPSSPTHPENNANKNTNNATTCDVSTEGSDLDDSEGPLLNDYRVSNLRKEELVEYNFGGAVNKTSTIVKRHSSKKGDVPVIQNLRQLYRKPPRVSTTTTTPAVDSFPQLSTTTTSNHVEYTKSNSPPINSTTTFSNPLEEVLTSKPPRSPSILPTNPKPPKSILRRSSSSSVSSPNGYNYFGGSHGRLDGYMNNNKTDLTQPPKGMGYRIAQGYRTKSELSLRDVEKALANARYNMCIAIGSGEPDDTGVGSTDDNNVGYNGDGSMQGTGAVRRIRFEPRAEHEPQSLLEDKSIAMIATPAHNTIMSTRAQPTYHSTSIGARANIYGVPPGKLVDNNAMIHPYVLQDSDQAKQNLHKQYDKFKEQLRQWQQQLQQNQAFIRKTTTPLSSDISSNNDSSLIKPTGVTLSNSGVTIKRAESDASSLRYTNGAPRNDRVNRQFSLRDETKNKDGMMDKRSILAERFRMQDNRGGNEEQLTLKTILRGDDLLAQKAKLKRASSSDSENLSPNTIFTSAPDFDDIKSREQHNYKSNSQTKMNYSNVSTTKPPVVEPKSILKSPTISPTPDTDTATSHFYNQNSPNRIDPNNQSRSNVALRTGPKPYSPPKPYKPTQTSFIKPYSVVHSQQTPPSNGSRHNIPPAPSLPAAPTILKPARQNPPKNSKRGSRFEPKLDPREELMIAIRTARGRGVLRKVAVTETKWH